MLFVLFAIAICRLPFASLLTR